MITNYPVGDFLIRVKNAARASHKEVQVPVTKLIKAVAEVLKKEGFVEKIVDKDGILTVSLAFKSKKPLLVDLKLVSRLGLRIYKNADELAAHRGASFFIISSSRGVISSGEAIKKRIGGEVIVQIW